MNYIHMTADGQPEYPYNLWQLRKAGLCLGSRSWLLCNHVAQPSSRA